MVREGGEDGEEGGTMHGSPVHSMLRSAAAMPCLQTVVVLESPLSSPAAHTQHTYMYM